jgi:hypothetical protein
MGRTAWRPHRNIVSSTLEPASIPSPALGYGGRPGLMARGIALVPLPLLRGRVGSIWRDATLWWSWQRPVAGGTVGNLYKKLALL